MNITAFIHPQRTYLPCSGAGRFIINTLQELRQLPDTQIDLLYSKQWLEPDGLLPANCPLRTFPFTTFPWPENPTERLWKLAGWPTMDSFVSPQADWVYCPMETSLPLQRAVPVASVIYDVQIFERDLPWSNTPAYQRQRRRWSWWFARAMRRARYVLTISEFTRQRMMTLCGVPGDKIVNVGCGVEREFFDIAEHSGPLPPPLLNGPYLAMIGGLRIQKGGDTFLQIADELQKRGSALRIAIAGRNDPAFERRARELPNIHLLGMVSDDALPAFLKHAVALLFPSLYEGFGIPPLEAMAVGTPAIVSNRASLPEVVGDAGFVFDPSDIAGITDTATRLATEHAFRATAVARGRSHAKQFTWRRVAQRIRSVLAA